MSDKVAVRNLTGPALRWAIAIILVVMMAPYLLTPLYLLVRPLSTPMLWRWATGAQVERIWVPLESMSAALPLAVLAAEDERFCEHHGIDWRELRHVVQGAEDAGEMRGGSTITQQTAKNLFLWQGRSFIRKALEFPLAIWIDLVMPKRRILEIYLNIAEWGPNGVFGAEAGARHAFAKSARDMNLHDAALLAAILPNPIERKARHPRPAVSRLAAIYQARALRQPQLDACVRRPG